MKELVVRPRGPVDSRFVYVPQFWWETWRYPLQVDSNLTVGCVNMSERPSDVCLAEIISERANADTIKFVNVSSSTFHIMGFCPLFRLWDFVLWDYVLWDFVRRDFILWDFVLWDSVRIP